MQHRRTGTQVYAYVVFAGCGRVTDSPDVIVSLLPSGPPERSRRRRGRYGSGWRVALRPG